MRPPADEAERRRFQQLNTIAFGGVPGPPSPEADQLADRLRDPARDLVALDDGRMVGGCATFDFRLTVPGGADVAAAGLAGVAVDQQSIGQGWLHRLMEAHLADARDRGDAVSILTSSESGLYRRFGYGWATSYAVLEATAAEARIEPVTDGGTLELVLDPVAARAQAAEAYRRIATTRAGTVSRSDAWWEVVLGPERTWSGGGPQLTAIHRDADGRPDGYLLYVTELGGGGPHGVPAGTVQVRELLGASPEVELVLWDHVTRVPLTRTVRWELAPVDTPIRWRLRDPRQLRTVAWRDMLWLRVLDVPGLLERRTYVSDGRVAFEVHAPDDERVAGTWTLEVDGGVAQVRRGGRAEVRMEPAELGATALGGVGLGALAAAGRVTGDAAAIARLGTLLASPTEPFCLSRF